MDYANFTVYFENPYWVGVIEHTVDEVYSVARIVFGPEPTDAEILEYLSRNYPNNVRFSKPVDYSEEVPRFKSGNPKRRQREAARLLGQQGTSTKAQETIRNSYEQYKQEKHQEKRQIKDAEADQKYQQKMAKKKQKRRGR
ncbi:MAG TPA: YjdF family protein [Lentimicrobium sp.]|nr:YjdF family protein [Lentimicrobium sp.]